MKVIKMGNILQINVNDTIDVEDTIPVGTYSISFAKTMGFFLEEHPPLEINEHIYGEHVKKAEKVIRSFERFERNLGVILSGPKGIGKSIFARQVCAFALEHGYPVIIVNQFIPGIADFIASIDQQCVFLFDEFEKTFAKHEGDRATPQEQLLPLFDGVEGGKRLFIVTCNETRQLNEYLVNRPGRFHYHFRFDYPSKEEVTEYMTDHLEKQYHDVIPEIVKFTMKANINYDCLRAIAFEINSGESFKEAMKDLNIMDTEKVEYNCVLHYTNGERLYSRRTEVDMFDENTSSRIYLYPNKNDCWIGFVDFFPQDCDFIIATGEYVLDAENFKIEYDEDDDGEDAKRFKQYTPQKIVIRRVGVTKNHYVV